MYALSVLESMSAADETVSVGVFVMIMMPFYSMAIAILVGLVWLNAKVKRLNKRVETKAARSTAEVGASRRT